MKTILSIQSHVSYGYVGNRAAVFPLQIMGYEVIAVNTVQFSNHPGHGRFRGSVFGADHIKDVLAGIEDMGLFPKIDAVLSGYLGAAAFGDIVLGAVQRIRAANPDMIYACDPVMGDAGIGMYVDKALPPFFKDRALAAASLATPNLFELEYLTDMKIETLEDARAACRALHDKGPALILLTSLVVKETPQGKIQMLASAKDGRQWIVTTPRLELNPMPSGAGDLSAALFLGRILAGEPADRALANTAGSVFGVFEKTQFLGSAELALIPAQDCFKITASPFEAVTL